jgi:dipeptidyl-peptidase-4
MMTTQTASAESLTLERVYASPDLSGPRARGVKLSPDGSAVTYMKAKVTDARMTDLWIAEVAGGEPRLLIDGGKLIPEGRVLSEAEKSRRERQGIQTRGVVNYAWDDQGRFILAPVEGDLWLYRLADSSLTQLTHSDADEIDAKVSPKGSYVSFVRGDNLYLMPSEGGAERALTTDGSELTSWATAEFIAQEEMNRDTGYWWSPTEGHIALAHVDQSGVDIVARADIGAEGAVIVNQRYPRVGRPNAVVDLYVADLVSGRKVKVDLGKDTDIYLARVDWSVDGTTLYVQRQTRDQKRLDILAIDPASGASKVILTEISPHWVELTHDFTPLKSGGFLWTSEMDGFRHIFLYDAKGKLVRRVTSGNWPVHRIAGVDESKGLTFFEANRDLPIERQLFSVAYAKASKPKALTPSGGWWATEVAKSGQAFTGIHSDPATPPRTGLYRADGHLVRWIEENRLAEGHPYWPHVERLRLPEYGTIKAADGQDLWWSLRTPPGFDPKKKYPVIVQTYGGPTSNMVTRAWMDPSDQLFLEAGYILFRLDNRGSPNRGVKFETALDRRLGTVEIADQIAGARHLASLAYVDPSRIGIMGWSYGGFTTLHALTTPDTPFAAGIAGAPPTDYRLYDTPYTERYMGTEKDNLAGYEGAEVTRRLSNLKPGSLLLMHGMADDNVTYDNSTRVMAALQSRAIAFESMDYPGLRHRAGWTQANYKHRMSTWLDFFGRKLKPGT